MKPPILECRSLGKDFGRIKAVDGVDLRIHTGEILAILGPSGCGKTTLLRLIAGFEDPDRGEVRIRDEIAASGQQVLPPEKRRVGMVFQDHALFPHLSVRENIAFGLKDLSPESRQARVRRSLTLIGLPGLSDRRPSDLSGGERQRVAVARALAPQPIIILLDEPFSNLDAERRVRIREQVRDILKRAAATAIFVTHDQEEAIFMGDRLGVMREGRLEQIGPAEDLFKAPATKFVAEFLGHAEFLPAWVTEDGLQTEIGPLPQATTLAVGTQVEVGFRADDVTFSPDPMGSAQITARFFQGAVTLYRLRLASGKVIHSMQPHYLEHPPGLSVASRFEPHHPLPLYRDGEILAPAPVDSLETSSPVA